MATDIMSFYYIIIPTAFVAGGVLVGYVFEKIILMEIKKIAARTKWEGDDMVIKSLHGMPVLWFFLAGAYGAIRNVEMSPALMTFLQKVLLVVAILSITWFFARILVGFVNLYSKKVGGALLATSMFENLTRILVFILGFLIILQSLGISITPILTALGVGGLAVALALQDTLSNLFSGIHVIASKQVRPGDYIKLNSGEEGYVADITWRYTTVRALPNNMIIIPNSKLASAIVTNFYYPEMQMAVLVQVGVSYDSDLALVEKVTIEVARDVMREIPGGMPDFEPFIRYHTFDDFSINFTVILRCKEFVEQYPIKHEFVKMLHKRYKKEGIEIPFPIRTVYMKEDVQ